MLDVITNGIGKLLGMGGPQKTAQAPLPSAQKTQEAKNSEEKRSEASALAQPEIKSKERPEDIVSIFEDKEVFDLADKTQLLNRLKNSAEGKVKTLLDMITKIPSFEKFQTLAEKIKELANDQSSGIKATGMPSEEDMMKGLMQALTGGENSTDNSTTNSTDEMKNLEDTIKGLEGLVGALEANAPNEAKETKEDKTPNPSPANTQDNKAGNGELDALLKQLAA